MWTFLYVDEFKYLGHVIRNDECDDQDIQREIRAMFTHTNRPILARRFSQPPMFSPSWNYCVQIILYLFLSHAERDLIKQTLIAFALLVLMKKNSVRVNARFMMSACLFWGLFACVVAYWLLFFSLWVVLISFILMVSISECCKKCISRYCIYELFSVAYS